MRYPPEPNPNDPFGNSQKIVARYGSINNSTKGIGSVMYTHIKAAYRKIVFHVVKVPLMFFLITLGYIIEFFINLPFILITFIDDLFQKKA